jgi:L-alanine-DL-glutamate epimerase-like enolase superfamily enzyme
MSRLSRRAFLGAAASLPLSGLLSCRSGGPLRPKAGGSKEVRVVDLTSSCHDYLYRTPIKFGGREVDRATILDVECVVAGEGGKSARGFGSMPLGNVWSFPSKTMTYDTTLGAMKTLAERIRRITSGFREAGHPIDINRALEPAYLEAAAAVSREMALKEPIPKLCALVTASAFDAAVHDAYGKLHGLNCYRTYGPEFLPRDLSHYLGADYRGERLDHYLLKDPQPRMPLYHLVGGVDPLEDSDLKRRVGDGLPETLAEWIPYNGLTHLKIKLNGEELDSDIERVVRIDRVTTEAQRKRGATRWVYSLDFNEKCRNVGYLLDFLNRLKEKTPSGFERIQYIEQPTARDLKADRANVMHEAAKLRPVVIDESLTDVESLLLAREMGYSGAALKACKGQSQVLLMAAVGLKHKMFLCVQDLTCPGASLIHSAGLAAHVPGVAAIEANARQYFPEANRPWEKRFPGIFHITDGTLETGTLTGPGLGAVEPA